MTTADFITETTDSVLTLVKENPTIEDESTLSADEYFALMVYTDYSSYHRNYKEYKGTVNENPIYSTYDLGIDKSSGNYNWYISKNMIQRYNPNKGRTIIVSVNDLTKCLELI